MMEAYFADLGRDFGVARPRRSRSRFEKVMYRIPERKDLVVNATSIGLFPATETPVPVDFEPFRGKAFSFLQRLTK
jgi:hypothetical protein